MTISTPFGNITYYVIQKITSAECILPEVRIDWVNYKANDNFFEATKFSVT